MIAGAIYAVIYLLALAPGLPLGFALFGRRHPAGWIAGAVLGYPLSALALWAPIRAGVPSAVMFTAAWLVIGVLAWLTSRRAEPLVRLPRWQGAESTALASVLLLTAAIAVPPLLEAGAADGQGNRYYRAYFTADFVWHAALTAEVAKFASPPRNPYLANRPIHYYWTYFLLPAAAGGAVTGGAAHVETFLKVNACGTALLFVSAIFLCAWTAVPRAWPVAAGVSLAIVASSAEGAFALWSFWQRGVPLAEVRNLNIDAIANWWVPHGLRIDGLQRCFWWVPQHSMAYALGLIALAVFNAAGSGASAGAIAIAGVALGGSTLMNPFVGGVFSLVWGGAVLTDAVRCGSFLARLPRQALAAVPVVLALAWCIGNQMVEGGGSALQFGRLGDARNTTLANLLLSLGPALVAAAAGLMVSLLARDRGRRVAGGDAAPGQTIPGTNARHHQLHPPVSLALLAFGSLFLLYFVRLDVDASWVGFRAGQLFLVAVPGLIAGGLATHGRWRAAAVTTVVLALAAGAPTTAIDAYNAQDITNFAESPIGPWTVMVTRDEREGLDWLRRETPPTAIVQMEPSVRARSTWSLIPSFAQRRMAAGQPISLLGGTAEDSEYGQKTARVRTMYAAPAAQPAWEIAKSLRIGYVWVDGVERKAYPAGVAKFDTAPQLFAPAWRNGEVTIYRVQ